MFQKNIFLVLLIVLCQYFFVRCVSIPKITVQSPRLNYNSLLTQYSQKYPDKHLSLTKRLQLSKDASLSEAGYLFYASLTEGSYDIWMNDLNTVESLPIIQHSANLHSPTIDSQGLSVVFVSEDQSLQGDLRIIYINPKLIIQKKQQEDIELNYWQSSINLSHKIDILAQKQFKDKFQCKGNFTENSPILNSKGDKLFFISDRCSKGFL